jgi:3-hydroxybutyryl-CoA dehydratase
MILDANHPLTLEDIKVGMEASYSQTITDADVKAYSGISGDKNPIHMDDIYASQSKFGKRIAHGMISSSFFSALFGTKLPGQGCVYVSQTLKFKKPVYLDETVTASVTVSLIDIERRRVFFKTVCKVNNKIVIEGEAELFVPKNKESFSEA